MEIPDLSPYYKVVEGAIEQLGIDPKLCRGEKEGQWNLKKNDTNVWIDLWYIEREQRPYYQVMSPILQVPPVNREKLYEELLQINDSLYGVAFTLYKDWVYLKVIKLLRCLRVLETMQMFISKNCMINMQKMIFKIVI